MHPFDQATTVAPAADQHPGHFTAELTAAWSGGRGPHGGVIAAIVVRAMSETIQDSGVTPRSLTLHYLRAPAAGEVQIAVELRRSGRRTANLSATMTQDGRECVLALATFAHAIAELDSWTADPPRLEPFDQAVTVPPAPGRPPFMDFLDMRVGIGPAVFSGAETAVSGGWLQFRQPRPIDPLAVAFFTDAWFPIPFLRVSEPVDVPTLDLTIHFRDALSPALAPQAVAVRFESASAGSGTFTEDGTVWTAGGRLIAQSRQTALLAAI